MHFIRLFYIEISEFTGFIVNCFEKNETQRLARSLQDKEARL